METGTVKWFSNSKGYGFISPDEREADIFAHFSAITMDGYRTLRRGQKVSFDITDGPKGLLALNIRPWPDDAESTPLSDTSLINSDHSTTLSSS
ncbi:Cold shock protein of CSP family [hydrothermal vent metagenome]|uniref:Cold shock protein of CSP family n=1 Tax=hydrothermal vent metagenome TaxID=652676 RepID=A0A3B0Z8G1_9ZZZZ